MADRAVLRVERRALAGFVARKQGLARAADAGVAAMAAQAFGFYGTAPTCHLSFLARLPSYRAEDLERAIAEERSVVRLRAMRKTLFLVATRDVPIVHGATRSAYRALTDRFEKGTGLSARQLAAAKRAIIEALREGPKLKGDIQKRVRLPESKLPLFDILMHALGAAGTVVRGASRRGWRSDVTEYALVEQWLPDFDADAVTEAEARAGLARRYLESYGPATEEDFRWWSGLSKPESAAAFAALATDAVPVLVDGLAGDFRAIAGEAELLSSTAPLEGVQLLPVWDGYLMAYRERDRYLEPKLRSAVFDRSGNGTSTLWIDGAIAGVWDFAIAKRSIEVKVAPFRKLPKTRWRAVRDEAGRIAALAGAEDLVLLECGAPPPLDAGIDAERKGYIGPGQNRFRSPLKDVQGAVVA